MPDAAPAQQDEDPLSAHVPAVVPPGPEREPREAGAGPAAEGARPGEPDGPEQPEQPEDDGPRPLGLRVAETGHAPVDSQLRRLEDADHLAVSGHLEVYEDVHRGLRDTLTALDRPAPGPPVPGHPYTRS